MNLEKEIVPPIYDKIGKFGEYSKEWILVESQGLKGFIDKEGNIVVPIKYTEVSKFDDVRKNWALVKSRKEKLGFIDKTGKEVIPVIYDTIEAFTKNKKKNTELANAE